MTAFAVLSMLLVGYFTQRRGMSVFVVLPMVVAVSFLLIAEFESPRHGLVRVVPENLVSPAQSLRAQ
jgi:hypothetical protein